MAFLLKVFSGSERLKEKQKSADIVNETFQAELNDVQTKLEVENYELQMLVEMIYDSSYPESQKFLKQPTKDRLYAHKETISNLLFGLAAQGVSVAPLILTHFQKYGCDAIADTLINLLELVQPLLASKDMPEFTSDDILDAIDIQWHSSLRSSPAFGSLRGSTATSPLQSPRSNLSPRQSFSNLSPRQSIYSPTNPFSMERMLGSSPGQVPPYRLTSPRKTRSFSFSPPSSLPDTVREGARAAPPRRSLSSHYPASDVGISQSYGERLQPLAEHDEETNTGFGKFRKHDDGTAELLPKDEADSCEKSSSYEADENNALSRNRPQSSSIGPDGPDGNDHTAEENCKDFSTAGHKTLAPVLPYSLSSNMNTGEFSKALSINIPRSSIPFELKELNGGQSAGRTQVADDNGHRNDEAVVKKSNETFVRFLPLGRVRSRSNSFDKPRLDFSHEQFDKSVRDVNAEVPSEGFSARAGGNEDTARNILESEVPFRDSFSSSNHERQIPEKDIVASSSSLPIKRNHVEDSEQRVLVMNEEELNSTDDSLTFEEGVEEDRVGVVKMVDVPTPQVAIKTQLQSDECEEVQEAKDSLSHNSGFYETSMPTLDHENVTVTVTDSPHAKEVEDESLDVPELSSLVESCEHDVQKELAPTRESHNEGEIIVPSSSSLLQGTNSENSIVLNNRASSLHDTQVGKFAQGESYLSERGAAVGKLGSSSWSEKSSSIQLGGLEYTGDAKELEDNIQNEMDNAEEDMGTNNEGRDGAVEGVEVGGAVDGVEVGGAVDGVEGVGAVDGVEGDGAVDGSEGDEDEDGNSSSMLIPASSVEDDSSSVSALIKDKEESYSSPVGPNEEFLAEKSGVQAEGEVEFQEQEPPHPRGIVEIGTDILSQLSFSDDYDDSSGDKSTSSSDDEISSSTSSSSEKRRSSSSTDDETDDESSLPSARAKGTEETTPSISGAVFDEDRDHCHVQNGEYLSSSDSSGLLSSIDGDEIKVHKAEETGLDLHVSNPELDLEQGAELHTPSYNLVTFDLTKLSRDDNEEISSCSSLQSEGGAVPNVTSESTSCDGLDMTLANCLTGKGLASPSNSTVSPSTVVTGASLLSLSPQYEDGLSDAITSEVVLSSKIDESQNLCSSVNTDAGVSTDHALDSKVAKRSLFELKDQDAEGAGVIHSVTLPIENVNEEADWKHLSENETKEFKNPCHSDSDLHVSGVEGETAPLQNVLEVDLRMQDCEPQSPQQLPIHSSNQQVARVNDPSVSLCSDVVTHAFLRREYVEDGLPSKDLVQNESVIPSHARVEESNDAELSGGETISGQKNESFMAGAADFQMPHNDSEPFFSGEALSNDFGDSSVMENKFRVSGHNEVNTSGDNLSQYAQDEEEQAVTIDSAKTEAEGSKSEDYLHHAEAEKHAVSTLASADAGSEIYTLKCLSIRSEQYEANGSINESIGKGSATITRNVNHSAEDPDDFDVSRDTDEKVASPSEQDDKEGVLSDQYGLNLADSKAKGDETGATEYVSNQLVSTESENEPAHSNENDLKERAIPGTSSLNLSSTIDEEDRNSLTDQVDEGHNTECKKLADGIPSAFIQFVEKTEVNDYEMGEPKHVLEANPLPAQRGEMSVLSVNSSELALFESQSKGNSGQEDVLQFPEHDHLVLTEGKRAGVAGATYITPSNICDGSMIYPVGHGHDEGKPDKEKDLVVDVDEVTLPSQAQDVEGLDFKQVQDGVNLSDTKESLHGMTQENGALGICDSTTNFRIDESESSRPSKCEDGKETQVASEVPKLSAYGYESSCSRERHPLEHTHQLFDMIPPAPEDTHPVKGAAPQFLADSALLELKEEELLKKGTLLEESGVALFKNEEVGEGSELSNGIQTAQLSEALTNKEADEWEINNENETQQVEKGSDTFRNTEEPAIEGMKEPILHTLERGAERDEKDNDMEFVTGTATYGVFLHNTKFLDSQGNFVRALTAPVTVARSTEVLQSGPERHSVRDSIICTPASSDASSWTHKNVRQRRYNFLWTLCCSCCSKPSAL